MWRCVTQRVGHRGAVLLFFGLLDLAYSLSLLKPPAEAAQSPTVKYVADVMPLPAWAAVWGLAGVVLLVGAFQKRRDKWAFAVAVMLKTLWGLTFVLGWMFEGLDRGWVTGIVWLAMAVMLYIISDWAEPWPT